MSIGLGQTLAAPRISMRFDQERIETKGGATASTTASAPSLYEDYRADFDASHNPGGFFNIQRVIPNRLLVVLPAGSTDHKHPVAKITEAAIGVGARSIASYLPSLFAPVTAAIGAGGLTFWLSRIFPFFGSKQSDV